MPKHLPHKDTRVFSWITFTKNKGRKPDKNSSLRWLECMPRNLDRKCRSRIPSLYHNSINHSAIKGLFVNSVVKYKQLGKQGWLTVWINLRSADLSILAFIYVILAQLKLIKPVFCRSSDFLSAWTRVSFVFKAEDRLLTCFKIGSHYHIRRWFWDRTGRNVIFSYKCFFH
jgi:hypothetical protein